jgi:phage/plasmid-associated DNA primase
LIDFKLASDLILPEILGMLPPGEMVTATEYGTRNPTRPEDSRAGNFNFNIVTGAWIDNARPGDKGGDAVSLYAYINGMTQSEAAREILKAKHPDYFEAATPKPKDKAGQFWEGWRLCTKGNKNAPPLEISARKITEWGPDIERWPLIDRNVVAWIVRFQKPGEKKFDRPFTLWTKGGEFKWRACGVKDTKYPLYNHEKLIDRPNDMVILCEGQKVPSRLEKLPEFEEEFVIVGWYGGAGNIELTNLEPLRGREVIFPFDADLAGRKVLKTLSDLDIRVHPVYPPIGCAKGWDLADAISDGWDSEKIRAHLDNWKIPASEQRGVSLGKFEEPDYLDNTTLHEVFISEKYPNGGYFCYDSNAYTWNGLYWESRGINSIIEEFNQWAYHSPGTFKRIILEHNLTQEKESKQLDPQVISERAARNLKSYRGARAIGTENPFSQLKEVRPYWNFPNGMLEIKTDGITWFSRSKNTEQFFMDKYPMGCMGFDYDPDAIGCPLFKSTVNRLLPDGHKNEAGLKFILQTFAYSLLPIKIVPYYFVIYGLQGSGKSSLVTVLKELAGNYFIDKAMKEIFQEFGKSSLVGKLIAYDDDLPDDYILPAEIKKLAGNKEVMINEKRQAHFQAILNIAPWMCGNKPPATTGSDGHGRRAIIMHYSSKEPKDALHMQKMFGKIPGFNDERAAIMNLVLEVLPGFIANNYEFDKPSWAVDNQKEWLETNNSIAMFFSEMRKPNKKIWYDRAIVYAYYKQWAEISGYKNRTIKRNEFYQALPGENIEIKRTSTGRLVLCEFEIPTLSAEDKKTLQIENYGGYEIGETEKQDNPPF